MTTEIRLNVPDAVYDLIETAAEREYRTIEGQALWMLERQAYARQPPARMTPDPVKAQALTAAVVQLHTAAGRPSSRTVATAAGDMSHTTVNEFLNGNTVPSWPIVERIVTALNGDVDRFKEMWQAVYR